MGAFGEKLRKQREQRGITLDAISSTTKISNRMLRALEDEHFDQLPGGVFNKGFVRAYARQVGLDEEEAVADYLTALRESQIQQQSILPDFHAPARNPGEIAAAEVRQENRHTQQVSKNDPGEADPRMPDLSGKEFRKTADRRRQGRRDEDRGPRQTDLSSVANASIPAPAAYPLGDRSGDRSRDGARQKYPAGNPAQAAGDSSISIPWGKLAVALLLVTFALAIWNSRRHGEAVTQPAVAAAQPVPAPVSAPVSQPSAPATQSSASSLKGGQTPAAKTPPEGSAPPASSAARPSPPPTTGTSVTASRPVTPAPGLAASPAAASPTVSKTSAGPGSASAGSVSFGSASAAPGGSTGKVAAIPVAASVANPPSTKGSGLASAVKAPSTFTLLIRAEKTTWVSISADGKPVAEETLIAPAHTSVRASTEVVVKAGNAAGVSFQLNGKDIAAQGSEGEVKTYVFDASGVRVVPQPQSPATNH